MNLSNEILNHYISSFFPFFSFLLFFITCKQKQTQKKNSTMAVIQVAVKN
jgi:hypothetical protein